MIQFFDNTDTLATKPESVYPQSSITDGHRDMERPWTSLTDQRQRVLKLPGDVERAKMEPWQEMTPVNSDDPQRRSPAASSIDCLGAVFGLVLFNCRSSTEARFISTLYVYSLQSSNGHSWRFPYDSFTSVTTLLLQQYVRSKLFYTALYDICC